MHIILVSHEFHANGAVMLLLHLATHLIRQRGWRVDILAPSGAQGTLRPLFEEVGVTIVESTNWLGYDVCIINTLLNGHVLEKIAHKIKTIFWVHEGSGYLWSATQTPREVAIPFQRAHKILFAHPLQRDQFFAPFLLGIPSARIEVIAPGVPPLALERTPLAPSPGKIRILSVGSVYGRKRPQDLIRAVVALNDPRIECVLVGWTGALETIGQEAMQMLASHPDLFLLTGALEPKKLVDYYAGSDIFCLASADETFGVAAVEAGSYGLPVVLTDLPVYQGMWQHGVNSLLVPVGDTRLLGWMLKILLDDAGLRKRIGQEAKKVASRYSLNAAMLRLEAVIHEVAGKP